MKNKKNHILQIAFYILLILTIFSCDTSTEVSKGSLTGTVSLEGQSDFSDITVALYDLAYLDTTIVRINNQYPQIGVHINQHTEFDHRLQSPIKSTETLADGSFELTKISTGTYNLVAQKENFGFKYIYNVTINKGENEISQTRNSVSEKGKEKREKNNSLLTSLSGRSDAKSDHLSHSVTKLTPQPPLLNTIEGELNNDGVILTSLARSSLKEGSQLPFPISLRTSDLTLYPETHISGNIFNNIVVASDHHLIIDDDTVFIPNTSSLTIHPGAVIRINPGVDLTIHGTLTAQGEEDNMFWITSNHGFDNSQLTSSVISTPFDKLRTGSMEKSNSQLNTHNSTLSNREIELYNSMELSSIATVENDLITWGKWDYANTSLLNQVNNLHMQNGIFRKSQSGFNSAEVDSTFCNNLLCENIVNASEAGIYYNNVNNGTIEKNVVSNCEVGLKNKNYCSPTIKNNYILECSTGLEISYYSLTQLVNNEFNDCYYGVFVKESSSPLIYYNNINANICIRTQYNYSNGFEANNNNLQYILYSFQIGWRTYIDISAENNYFFTIDDEVIQESIYDNNDIEPSQQQYYCFVNYIPFLNQIEQNAGIQ